MVLTLLSWLTSAMAMMTWEEVVWIGEWDSVGFSLYRQGKIKSKQYNTAFDLTYPMPVMREYPKASAQIKRLVTNAFVEGCTLEWALDSLMPDSGRAVIISDSLRRTLVYYHFRDCLARLKKPCVEYEGFRFLVGGGGTTEKGWCRYADQWFLPDLYEPSFYGFTITSWAPRMGSTLDSLQALSVFHNAVERGMFVSRTVDSVLSVRPRVIYDDSVVCIDAVFEFEREYWWPDDTFRVYIFGKNTYDYLFAFSSRKWYNYPLENLEYNLFYEEVNFSP